MSSGLCEPYNNVDYIREENLAHEVHAFLNGADSVVNGLSTTDIITRLALMDSRTFANEVGVEVRSTEDLSVQSAIQKGFDFLRRMSISGTQSNDSLRLAPLHGIQEITGLSAPPLAETGALKGLTTSPIQVSGFPQFVQIKEEIGVDGSRKRKVRELSPPVPFEADQLSPPACCPLRTDLSAEEMPGPKQISNYLKKVHGTLGQSEEVCNRWKAKTVGGQKFKSGNMHGMFWFNNKMMLAHRLAYTWFKGRIPPGYEVLHTCQSDGNCVNPHHLFVGTKEFRIKNTKRRLNQTSGHATITELPKQMWEIKDEPYDDEARGQIFGVSTSQTLPIVQTREQWDHVMNSIKREEYGGYDSTGDVGVLPSLSVRMSATPRAKITKSAARKATRAEKEEAKNEIKWEMAETCVRMPSARIKKAAKGKANTWATRKKDFDYSTHSDDEDEDEFGEETAKRADDEEIDIVSCD